MAPWKDDIEGPLRLCGDRETRLSPAFLLSLQGMRHMCEVVLDPSNKLPAEYLQLAIGNSAVMNITVHDPCPCLMKQNCPAESPFCILDQQKHDTKFWVMCSKVIDKQNKHPFPNCHLPSLQWLQSPLTDLWSPWFQAWPSHPFLHKRPRVIFF